LDERSVLTLREAWRRGVDELVAAGVEEAAADAELLLLHLLGIGKAELLRDWQEPWQPTPEMAAAWGALLRRRATGEPVQYVLGEQYFCGRRLIVNPAVLIPRPETELLAEAVLAEAERIWPGSGAADRDGLRLHVADVGTGSGALAVTLAAERPAWRVTASDLSAEALAVTRRNAEALGVGDRMAFVQGDLLEPFMPAACVDGHRRETIDILVSNPPYICAGDLPGLQREVRDFEPRLALDGGADGMAPYRRMAAQLRQLPVLPGLVGWEVGAGQAAAVADMLRTAGDWADIRIVRDYAGIDRHVLAWRG
jgi:release factor glutamine methyltransferase